MEGTTKSAWTSEKRQGTASSATKSEAHQSDEKKPSAVQLVWARYKIGQRLRSHNVEFTIYCVYLILLTWVVINVQDLGSSSLPSGNNEESFFTVDDIRNKFAAPFQKVLGPDEWFSFVNNTLLPMVSPLVWYDNSPINASDLGFPGTTAPGGLKLLGAISVRQVRVQVNSCPTAFEEDFRSLGLLRRCYGPYTLEFQDENDFGPPLAVGGLPKYEYSNAEENNEDSFSGRVAKYDGGGFVVLFQTDGSQESRDASVAKLAELRRDTWIDRQTRAIFIDMNLFNPVTNTLSIVRLLAELPAAGGVIPTLYMRHVGLGMMYLKYARNATLAAEVAMLILLLGFAISELARMRRLGLSAYFHTMWGLFDFSTIVLYIVAYGFRWRALDMSQWKTFPPEQLTFTSYSYEASLVVTFRNVLGMCAVFSWARLFKSLKRTPFMEHVFRALFIAIPDLLYFCGCFICVLFGFALAHFLAFGDEIYECRTLPSCMLLLWRTFLGQGDVVDLMIERNRVLGALFFIAWTSLSAIVLLNVFLGIIVDGYTRVANEYERISFGEYLQSGVLRPLRHVLVRYGFQTSEEEEAAHDSAKVMELLSKEMEEAAAQRQLSREQQARDVAELTKRKRKKQQERIEVLMQSVMS
eukprot:CAMPEP_0114133990 /NCGR_PEP_ID=MMETSP0043_2-20121206/13919_1 /TAXON_ID=464988 /ORGANISM="Hemiselmis andersenii, Strain CCMP644" /LENGTH=637 /DNA_ID=CAMNT_0001227601 /DNA_START=37 /DNA_END=1947 /DNA_ORIENTATION=-